MSFIHGYILGGLVLAGVPILLHLIMRQKPKRLPFPAFRFLKQRHRINQRRLRLQHLLLLLLRVLVIASLCLALARPRVFSHRLSLGAGRPVSAVLVFDTSPSMAKTPSRACCMSSPTGPGPAGSLPRCASWWCPRGCRRSSSTSEWTTP